MTKPANRASIRSVSRYRGTVLGVLGGAILLVGTAAFLAQWRFMVVTRTAFLPPGMDTAFWPVVSSLFWLLAGLSVILLQFLYPRPAPSVVGLLQALSLIGLSAFPHTTALVHGTLVVLTLLALLIGYRLWTSVVLSILVGTGSVAFLLVGEGLSSAAYLSVAIVGFVLGGFWMRLEAREWSRQFGMYNQARWAASEFIAVNVRMQDSIDRTAGLTRMRERVRVAREIHDTVGYTLTAVLMQIQAAQEVYRATPTEVPARLTRLEGMVRDSIQEVRREVSELRDETVVARAGNSRWQRLCDAFADGTGIRVHAEMADELETVSPPISETIYRVLQEALTNAYRHGGADYVDVRMAWDREPGRILLRVSDNGKGAEHVSPGNGLTGMRERVEELSGDIAWRTAPGQGFDLGIELPFKDAARESDSSIAG